MYSYKISTHWFTYLKLHWRPLDAFSNSAWTQCDHHPIRPVTENTDIQTRFIVNHVIYQTDTVCTNLKDLQHFHLDVDIVSWDKRIEEVLLEEETDLGRLKCHLWGIRGQGKIRRERGETIQILKRSIYYVLLYPGVSRPGNIASWLRERSGV